MKNNKMMIQQIIILTALILGSITDLKKREVPDTLNYSLIIIGLLMNLTLTIINSTGTHIISSITGLGAGFLIGALFYYTGQWGGGDAKLIMGIGAIIGINPFALTTIPPFLLFIITSLIIGAVYGVIWMIGLTIKDYKEFKKEYKKLNKKTAHTTKPIKITLIILATILLIGIILGINTQIITIGYLLILLATLATYSKNYLRAIENTSLTKTININEATEGDWSPQEFKFKEKTIKPDKTGLSIEDINYLKQKGIKKITIKEGIPFVPSFLISYTFILITGNWFLLIL
jgi:Flp pilus assembly protein protease CpaA